MLRLFDPLSDHHHHDHHHHHHHHGHHRHRHTAIIYPSRQAYSSPALFYTTPVGVIPLCEEETAPRVISPCCAIL